MTDRIDCRHFFHFSTDSASSPKLMNPRDQQSVVVEQNNLHQKNPMHMAEWSRSHYSAWTNLWQTQNVWSTRIWWSRWPWTSRCRQSCSWQTGSFCYRTLFFLLVIFVHFRPNFTSHSLPHLSPSNLSLLCSSPYAPYALTLMNKRQECNLIGTTGHWTTCLLGYRHSETVLLWFPFTWILCWNLLCHHRMLSPLKVLDFPDMEHE